MSNSRQETIDNLKGTIAKGGNEKMIEKVKRRLKAVENNEPILKR